ncbi:MAG: rod shape-determining protein MreC [Actinomycetota bacterium]|jgi:rod shape-determining protein MreC
MARGGNNRSRLLLVILLVSSLFFITLDLRGAGITSASREVTQSVLSPIQKAASNIFAPLGRFVSDVKNFGKTKAQIAELKAANAKLKSQAIFNADTKGQLAQLKNVLDLAGRGSYAVVSARVVGRGSASTFSQTLTLDAGTSSGIRKNMTVISANGLVGVIKEATSSSSIVLLMSDPTFRIGVRVARSQSVGVVIGQGSGTYVVELLDPSGSLRKGDSLISIGSDNNRPYIPGLPVGYVVKVDTSTNSLTQRATVKSYSNLNDLGVVSVVVKAPTSAPKQAINPTPRPIKTIYVTPTPTPSVSSSPSPTASKVKK